MGAIHVDVTIRNLANPSRSWRGPFLVDTGATDSVVARHHLEAIGVTPGGQRTYELADGRAVQMDIAVAQIEFLGEFVGGTVIFGEPGTEPLLGVTALESMGVEVDPRNQELRKLTAVRLKRIVKPELLTFSQAHGYEDIPAVLRLEEFPDRARIRIGNVLVSQVFAHSIASGVAGYNLVGEPIATVLKDLHMDHHGHPVEDWSFSQEWVISQLRQSLLEEFFKVFDMIQFILRHPECPPALIHDMKKAFRDSRLAYVIDDSGLPTITPAVTAEEGQIILSSRQELASAGLDGAAEHLRKSSEYINRRDWAASVRESIHAVESVARKIDPSTADRLKVALRSLENRVTFHPALKQAILKLYGYTSDEQGIRHSLLDEDKARVDIDEAVFMLGACASFASYLWRKHLATS